MGKPLADLTGDRYGKLTVIARDPVNYRGNAQWVCRCECGKVKTYIGMDLRKGRLRSCGCQNPGSQSDHGMSSTPTYRAWVSMKVRCNNPKNVFYRHYGGRGIKVCDRWQNSFESFFADMGARPPKHSIDRIDPNGNYEPGNCRWATQREQMNNRRCNRFVEIDGKTQTLATWLRESGLKPSTYQDRIVRGWDIERAIKTPPIDPGAPKPRRKH
jgi:hypothetical protein